jgi:hypothetical protein
MACRAGHGVTRVGVEATGFATIRRRVTFAKFRRHATVARCRVAPVSRDGATFAPPRRADGPALLRARRGGAPGCHALLDPRAAKRCAVRAVRLGGVGSRPVGSGSISGEMAPELVVVQGLRDTRGTLARWNSKPWATLGPWFASAFGICVTLLLAVLVIAHFSTADPSGVLLPGLNEPATVGAVGHILFRNSLVLALHAMACVAGFIAGSSLPLEAERYSGLWRWIHDKAGPLAIAFVIAATTFSLFTQAYALGHSAVTLAAQGHMPVALLLVGILPHAIPELVGLFLPLAAWTSASRRGAWDELLAATFVTVAIAVPMVVAAAFIEVYVSPHLILALR